MDWEFEAVAGPYGGTTEGPVWDGQYLLFTHIPGNRIMRFDPRTGACTEFRNGTHLTNGLCLDADGRLYGCQADQHCIARFEHDGSVTRLPNRLDGCRQNRPNDLAIDGKGRIWFSDAIGGKYATEERELDHASVLRLDPQSDGNWILRRMTFDTTSPNGVLLSRDERTLFVAESNYKGIRELRAYPLNEDDTLGTYIVLHAFGQDARGVHRGVDGMCLDTEGNIIATAGWCASGPGPMIYVFTPSGRVLETHPTPITGTSPEPKNCAFGDADLSTLYVTTGNGHLYRVRNTGRRGWRLYPR
jgi:gluconolactonase